MSPFDPARRALLGAFVLAAGGATISGPLFAEPRAPNLRVYRTPFKYGKLVLAKSGIAGRFDEKSVDCPFVFSANGQFYMTYIGYDGIGYQTGLASSKDLVHWENQTLIMARDPSHPVFRYNVALMCILRDNDLASSASLQKVNGRYLGAWHAYPNAGYEEGPAVIGLAWSDDLIHWERGEPILRAEDGAAWERGGLYKPYLLKSGDTYYIFYNAKNDAPRGWIEQSGVATSKDLKTWTRHPANPILPAGGSGSWDERFASDPVVFRHGEQWAMFYYGLSADGKARDLLAVGDSLERFTKVPEILIDVGAPGTVDETYAHKPAMISHDGALYHYYCAVSGQWPNETRGISVARSKPW